MSQWRACPPCMHSLPPEPLNEPPAVRDATRAWERSAPLLRRWSARLGLQGKLILSFTYLLVLSLGASCWLFGAQSSRSVDDIMGEQARQIAYALSLSAKSSVQQANADELGRIGKDLLKTRNVLFVAFLDGNGDPLAMACRDPGFAWDALRGMRRDTQGLLRVHRQTAPVLGEYLAVMAPVLTVTSPAALHVGAIQRNDGTGTQLVGYVVVGLSQWNEQAALRRVNYMVMMIGALMLALSLPLTFGIVHRIFLPIRQLVAATQAIAAGDLGTRVAVHRPDLIGTLARSFNEMVRKVHVQQLELEAANGLLASANEDLEQKVAERTAQLEATNARLSREIAEKEDFLRTVSHDLNAPLRNIAGMATVLLMKHRQSFDDDVIHRLERIQKNVEVESGLIAELLELSRIKTRRQKLEPVELDALVRDMAGVFEDDLRARGILFEIDGRLPVLTCERARVQQVFQNLIDNAIKYMGEQSPVREIRVGCEVRPTEAEFYVRDTGIGIEPADLDRVFHVFRRGRSAAVQGVPGKGVGLASVKSIVETYGGRIWVESTPGKGSTVRFTVGAAHLAQPPAVSRSPTEARAS